jgi:hypothetical protein
MHAQLVGRNDLTIEGASSRAMQKPCIWENLTAWYDSLRHQIGDLSEALK